MALVDTAKIGKKGGEARAKAMSPAKRKESAVAAIKARWKAYYAKHPEKLKARQEREAKRAAPKKKTPAKARK